jgi:DNA-directed RNA polymerase specialized sigma24 family protein
MPKPIKDLTDAERDRIVSLYGQGQSSLEVGKTCGVTATTVLKLARLAGVNIRSCGSRGHTMRRRPVRRPFIFGESDHDRGH